MEGVRLLIQVEQGLPPKNPQITVSHHQSQWGPATSGTLLSLLVSLWAEAALCTLSCHLLIMLSLGCLPGTQTQHSKLSLSAFPYDRVLWLQVAENPNKSDLNSKGSSFSLVTKSLEVGWVQGCIIPLLSHVLKDSGPSRSLAFLTCPLRLAPLMLL